MNFAGCLESGDEENRAAGVDRVVLNRQADENSTKTKRNVSETVSAKMYETGIFFGMNSEADVWKIEIFWPENGSEKWSKRVFTGIGKTLIFCPDWFLTQIGLFKGTKIKIRHSPQNSAHNIGRKNSMFIHQSHKECGRIRPWKSSSGFPKFPFFFLLTIF